MPSPGRARKKSKEEGAPRESGGQEKGAAGDRGRPRADHWPTQLLDSISALIATYIVDNMLGLLISPSDAVWRATLRSPRTPNVLMSISR